MRVLVVDDSRAMRMIVTRELRGIDAVSEVVDAESAEAAIEVLGTEAVDLILCDWNMGGMTGLELLQALRAARWTVPFGFITSESAESTVSAAMEAGASFLIAKPFTSAELAALVVAALGGETVASSSAGEGCDDRATQLHRLLGGLLRKEVVVAPASSGPPRQSARWSADYVDSKGTKSALFVVETPLASGMSAALTMMPRSVAEEWADSGALPAALSENFHEVANVVANALRSSTSRCVLNEIAGYAPGERHPDIEQIKAARQAEHFNVSVDGYGTGLLSLVTF